MSNTKRKTIAIIPAKAYSRRVPNKNMRLLSDKPLLYYSITATQKSPLVDEVYVSTDDPEIASFAKSLGASVPFLRDKSLSGDMIHATEPVLDMLRRLYPDADTDKSLFCLRVLPPYPFVSANFITEVVAKSHETGKNVLSILPLDINIYHLKTHGKDGIISSATDKVAINFQIDAAPGLFALAGAAQCAPASELLRHGSYHYGKPLGHILKKIEGFETDTPDAFSLAEKLISVL